MKSRVLVVVAALLGLVAMHGVSGHGAHGLEPHSGSIASTPVPGSAHGWGQPEDQERAAAVHCPGGCATSDATEAAAAVAPEGESSVAVIALCLAVLLTAVAALTLGGRRGSLALLQAPRPPRVPRRHPYALRIHAPPDLHQLSILRC